MLAKSRPRFLLVSDEPALLSAAEPILLELGARVEVVLSSQAALASARAHGAPDLALVDANLPDIPMGQFLAALRAEAGGARLAIVLISDTIGTEWTDRLADGLIDDLIARTDKTAIWKLRLGLVLRTHALELELETLRAASALNSQLDGLTGVYNREALMAMLFRETDRVQRLHSPLCLVLFDIDDFGHWNSRLDSNSCDELLRQAAARTERLLRSYDLLGRPGLDEFLVVLPGCSIDKAAMLVERLRMEVFSVPFHVAGESIRLSACFGIASSQGRSPVVVLREAEAALDQARAAGPESVRCFGESPRPIHAPVSLFPPASGDELPAW